MKEHFRTLALDQSGRHADVTGEWPPCCCVPAFVASALREFGHSTIDRASLARKLGTRVGLNDDNPWQLPIETEAENTGISAADAQTCIPSVLKEFDNQLSFRRVPFRIVTLGLYPELLIEATGKGCVVGVGFNYGLLLGRSGKLLHVSRVSPAGDLRQVLLVDDSSGFLAQERYVSWRELEDAVYSVDDGFWIVGTEAAIASFEFAHAAG